MSEAFLEIVNMSISASWLVLAVLVLRYLLKKAPKWVNVLLWGIVAVRILCPFSIESAMSLIPSRETISPEIMMDRTPEISTGIKPLDQMVNPVISTSFAPEPTASANPLQILIPVAANLWLLGVLAMMAYTAISYLRLRRKLRTATVYRGNIFRCETVSSPFVLGVVKPKIYLPYGLDGQNLSHVVAHEQAHIRRKDHWWKPLGFLLLTVHWFNPLMWVAYILLCRDIELACDEKVIAELGNEQRADYTQALVSCSVNRRVIAACPLAFGEVGVKERVKSIMNYRKPTFWIVVTALVVCAVVAVCFLTDPNPSREFAMNGSNVSDLNPEAIVERILDIEDWESSNVYVNVDNFSLTVDGDFNWADSQAVRYWFGSSKVTYAAQLRIFPEENKYFLTEPEEWTEPNRIFLLRHYLDAIKYLPQNEIRQLAPADRYIIQFVDGGSPADYDRVLTYSSEGVGELNGWNIHLQIQPFHADGDAYSGTGDEIVELFYGESVQSSYSYVEYAEPLKYYLTIPYEAICRIEVTTETSSGGCVNADGSCFEKGERVWLEQLDGMEDLRGVEIAVYDQYGVLVKGFTVPPVDYALPVNTIASGGWILAPEGAEQAMQNEILHMGLNAEIVDIDYNQFILYVKDVESSDGVFGDRCAIHCEYAIEQKNLLYVSYTEPGEVRSIGFEGFEIGDQIIVGMYDSEKQKAFNGNVSAVQIQLSTQKYENDSQSIKMIPTQTSLEGLHAGALLLPMDGSIYRYELTLVDPEGITAEQRLFLFTEDTGMQRIAWEVYSLKEYPDKSAVLMISDSYGSWFCTYAPPRRCSDTALQAAVSAGCVVMENGYATYGQDAWQEFYDLTRQGQPATVTVASYWILDSSRTGAAYYEVYNQDYPCMYKYQLDYDGETYTLTANEGGEPDVKTYKYLMKYEVSGTGADGNSTRYVLTHSDTVTWEELWNGLVSSWMGAYIDHNSIYTEKTVPQSWRRD